MRVEIIENDGGNGVFRKAYRRAGVLEGAGGDIDLGQLNPLMLLIEEWGRSFVLINAGCGSGSNRRRMARLRCTAEITWALELDALHREVLSHCRPRMGWDAAINLYALDHLRQGIGLRAFVCQRAIR